MTIECYYHTCKLHEGDQLYCSQSHAGMTCVNTIRTNQLHELIRVVELSRCNDPISGERLANVAYMDRGYTDTEMNQFLDSLSEGEIKEDFSSEFEELCVK